MAVPISAAKRLERKEAGAQRRVDELRKALKEALEELEMIKATRSALSQGERVNLREILGEVRPSQKDYILEAVRKRPSRGMARTEIIEYLNSKKNIDISPGTITAHLYT